LKHYGKGSACDSLKVAPPAGAWIETKKLDIQMKIFLGRAPRGRVD